jgi:hypothetical protein
MRFFLGVGSNSKFGGRAEISKQISSTIKKTKNKNKKCKNLQISKIFFGGGVQYCFTKTFILNFLLLSRIFFRGGRGLVGWLVGWLGDYAVSPNLKSENCIL